MKNLTKNSLLSLAAGLPLFCGVAFAQTVVTVDDDGPADYTTIQAAIDGEADNLIINVAPGVYNDPVNIVGRNDIWINGAGVGQSIMAPSSNAGFPTTAGSGSRRSLLQADSSTNINFSGFDIDFANCAGNNVFIFWAYESTGSFTDSAAANSSIIAPGTYSEGAFHARTRFDDTGAFNGANRADFLFKNLDIVDSGRIAIWGHAYVDIRVENCSIARVATGQNVASGPIEHDFGYGIEMGSVAQATIIGCQVTGYDGVASDGSGSAGYYIHNAFSDTFPSVPTKTVSILNNYASGNSTGIYVGNTWICVGGPTPMSLLMRGNTFENNHDIGMILADASGALGGSIDITGYSMEVFGNGSDGIYVAASTDSCTGNPTNNNIITADFSGSTIKGHSNTGLYVSDAYDAPDNNNVVDVVINGGNFYNNAAGVYNDAPTTHTVDATNNWWGDSAGPEVVSSRSAGSAFSAPVIAKPFGDIDLGPLKVKTAGDHESIPTRQFSMRDSVSAGVDFMPFVSERVVLDADGDSVTDAEELAYNGLNGAMNPADRDTDGDGVEDGVELYLGTDPTDPADTPANPPSFSMDSDGDGYSDAYEVANGSDPNDGTQTPNLGDMSEDGGADNVDALIIFNIFLGNIPADTFALDRADVNRDGVVDNVDAVILFNWFLGNVPYIPFP